jgi:hypothetical protein
VPFDERVWFLDRLDRPVHARLPCVLKPPLIYKKLQPNGIDMSMPATSSSVMLLHVGPIAAHRRAAQTARVNQVTILCTRWVLTVNEIHNTNFLQSLVTVENESSASLECHLLYVYSHFQERVSAQAYGQATIVSFTSLNGAVPRPKVHLILYLADHCARLYLAHEKAVSVAIDPIR